MQPGAVRAKKQFSRATSLECLNDVIELPHSGSIGIHVGITGQLVSDLLVSFPVVGEAAEVRQDEVHLRILWRQHVYDFSAADDIEKNGQTKQSGRVAYLAGREGFVAVHLDATETPVHHGVLHHPKNSSRVAFRMNESKSDQTIRMPFDQASYLSISLAVVAVKGRQHDRFVDSGSARATKVCTEWRVSVPGRRHLVPFAGVAMAINDHEAHSFCPWLWPAFPKRAARAAMYQIEVSIPR